MGWRILLDLYFLRFNKLDTIVSAFVLTQIDLLLIKMSFKKFKCLSK